jgi:hypothetical protein
MSQQTEVMLFGGPGHRDIVYWEPSSHRLEMLMPRPTPRPYIPMGGEEMPWAYHRAPRTSYYRQTWREVAYTWAGAKVIRSVVVGVWEGGELTRNDKWELDSLLLNQEWEWVTEPSFLKAFNKWYEKVLHDLDWQKVRLSS